MLALVAITSIPNNNKKIKLGKVEKSQNLLAYKLNFCTRNKNLSGIDEEFLIAALSDDNNPYGWDNTSNMTVLKDNR